MNRIVTVVGLCTLGMAVVGCDQATLQRAFSADPKAQQWTVASPRPTENPTKQSTETPTEQSVPSTKPLNPALGGTSPAAGEVSVNPVNQVPLPLQPYVEDVETLQALTIKTPVMPNQPISRAQFARWLVELNNRLHRDRPARQIRLALASAPAFLDVPKTHPDFAFVQGLAESGYLPSPLSGDKSQARFRPQDPLTRETLLLWKVPIDRQQILPTVSVARVKQLWGFKDANRITPNALSAIAADYQNGDLSNIRRMLGSTLLLQPQKPVTQAEAIAALWFIGIEGDSFAVPDLLRAEQQTTSTESPAPSPKEKTNTDPSSP